MKIKKFNCCVCGKEESTEDWVSNMASELEKYQMCFECNHWRKQHELDTKNGDYTYAVVGGGHYRLCPPTDSYFKGFGDHLFTFRFKDGTIRKCNNVWFQGDITEAHPHWREVMPDNAEIIQNV